MRIDEVAIPPTPVPLDRIDAAVWRNTLELSQDCLDTDSSFRGRGRQVVTLAASRERVEKSVSPHLQFRTGLWVNAPLDGDRAVRRLRETQDCLRPLYDFVTQRSA